MSEPVRYRGKCQACGWQYNRKSEKGEARAQKDHIKNKHGGRGKKVKFISILGNASPWVF